MTVGNDDLDLLNQALEKCRKAATTSSAEALVDQEMEVDDDLTLLNKALELCQGTGEDGEAESDRRMLEVRI